MYMMLSVHISAGNELVIRVNGMLCSGFEVDEGAIATHLGISGRVIANLCSRELRFNMKKP